MINRNKKFIQQIITFILTFQVRCMAILFWALFLIGFLLLSHVSMFIVEDRSLSIYMWADKIDESILQKFEKETGIKIYANYYESNEELVTKFEIGKDLNCDLIIPSEYIVRTLTQGGFLKPIDKTRCDFIHKIYPEFLGYDFDKNNEYSLPIYWDFLGLGYTKSYFEHGLPSESWKLIFDKNTVPCKQISMVDDSREAIFLAYQYFGWNVDLVDDHRLYKIKNLFIEQKEWVGAYTDFQHNYFLTSKTYPLVVSQREAIVREMITHDDIHFVLPQEGSLLILSNVVICKSSEKDDLIYQFLNFLYRHDVMTHNCKEFCLLSTVKNVMDDLPFEYIGVEGILPGEEHFDQLKLFPNVLTQKQINDLWIAFKSF
jgi:spermidine/putrescine transport system substrate-binding protein